MAGHTISHIEWEASKSAATDKISVQNLGLFVNAGFDIWGRRKAQPAEISVSLSLKNSFTSAAASDSLDSSTIHYGNLSKLILELEQRDSTPWTTPDDLNDAIAFVTSNAALNPAIISVIEIQTCFKKASRFGRGVSLLSYRNLEKELNSNILFLDRLAIPALVGINSHERTMKQIVIVSIWIDRVKAHITEGYCEVEQLLVKTVEESSFETLESLAEEVASRTIKYFIFPKQQPHHLGPEPAGVRVRIEKPSAVPRAQCPVIEIYRSAESQDPYGRRMLAELGSKRPEIPFPLEGRLDEFLQSWKQD